MYTKARIGGHPIHPMLIAFPVALYAITFVAIIVHVVTRDAFWYRAATTANIAGIVMALVAAVFGLIDLIDLPAHARAKTTGLRHAGLNVLALGLFVVCAIVLGRNWFGGTPADRLDDGVPFALSLLGLIATVFAGWLGWTLVQTHHVGVRPTMHASQVPPKVDEVDDLDELISPPPVTVIEHTEVHAVQH
jgi:uncharacterized membrane protein